MNISVERQRLLKKWARKFLLFAACGIGTFGGLLLFAFAMVKFAQAFGPPAVLGFIFLSFVTTFVVVISYHAAKEEIQREDVESERTMNALRKDYTSKTSSLDQMIADVRNRLNQKRTKI